MIIAGNWKMNLLRQEAVALARHLDRDLAHHPAEIIIFPATVLIPPVIEALGARTHLHIGAQDCHAEAAGAHTGDTAARMLADAGCTWVLVGHSERRLDHGEDSRAVAAKASQAITAGLKPMICVGESLAEREAGNAEAIVADQIRQSLPAHGDIGAIAYEPVWAIGTGRVASIENIAAMHRHIHNVLTDILVQRDIPPILYGGSVKPDNAAEIMEIDHVGGVLVGGASLTADEFLAIAGTAT